MKVNIQAIGQFAAPEMLKDINTSDSQTKTKLLHTLLDQHGTGRLLFRNSRAGVSGFPKRKLYAYSLVQPIEYSLLQSEDPSNLQLQLTPERHPDVVNTWVDFDPRVEWFMTRLKSLKGEKGPDNLC